MGFGFKKFVSEKLKKNKSKTEFNILNYDLADLDIMNGSEFEEFLEKLFTKMGYSSKITKISGDQGADLIIEKNGQKIAVQAKRYSKKVTNSAIQEVAAALQHYDCQKGIVVTTNNFTASAKTLAESNNVELIHRSVLESLIKKYPIIKSQTIKSDFNPESIIDEIPLSSTDDYVGKTIAFQQIDDKDLSNYNFSETIFPVQVEGTNFSGANFQGLYIKTMFLDCDFTSADFTKCTFHEYPKHPFHSTCIFKNAILSGIKFKSFGDILLSSIDFSGANLSNSELTKCVFDESNLSGANLSNCNLTKASFHDADLTNADLRDADLTNADLRDADLTNANLRGANVTNAKFRGAILNGTALSDDNSNLR